MGKYDGWQWLGELSKILQTFRHMYLHRKAEEKHPALGDWRRELRQFLNVSQARHSLANRYQPASQPDYVAIKKYTQDHVYAAGSDERVIVFDATDCSRYPYHTSVRCTLHLRTLYYRTWYRALLTPARSLSCCEHVQDLLLSCRLAAREEEGSPWVHYQFDTFCSVLTHGYCDW